jgi:HK97 family phage major capsid protein
VTAPTVPTNTADLEDALSDAAKVSQLVKNGEFGTMIRSYIDAQMNAGNGELGKLMAEQAQLALANMLRENGYANEGRIDLSKAVQANRSDRRRMTVAERKAAASARAAGVGLNGKFEDIGDFVRATMLPGSAAEQQRSMILNYMSEKVPSSGGLLVPEEFRSGLMQAALESAIVRPRATVIPMETAALSLPVVDSTTNVSSVFGGIVAYWTEEGAELTESEPKFGRVRLEPKKLTALTYVTNELLRDWSGLNAFIDDTFPAAIAWYEDKAFMSGTGVSEPLGMLSANNSALITVNKESGQAASTIVWENVIRMYARMLPTSLGRAIWLVTPDAFAELATMALSVGTGGSAMWLTDGREAPRLTLLGRPVIMTEKMPSALGTQGDIAFVDPTAYLIGDRMQMVADSSTHVRFTSDQTAYRFISRVDGRPWVLSAITPANNSATLSPFIQLQTRS